MKCHVVPTSRALLSQMPPRPIAGEFVHPSYDIGQVSPTPSEEEELAARGEWEDAIPDMLSVLDSLAKRQRSIQDQSQELVVALHKGKASAIASRAPSARCFTVATACQRSPASQPQVEEKSPVSEPGWVRASDTHPRLSSLPAAAYALGAKSAMHKLGLAQVDDARPDQTVDLSAPSAVQALRGEEDTTPP